MKTRTKIVVLLAVVLSQVIYVKQVVLVEAFHATTVAPGQVWEYKCTLPFHEKDKPERRTVIGVTNGYVQYSIPVPELPGGVFVWDCTARIFVIDSTLIGTNLEKP